MRPTKGFILLHRYLTLRRHKIKISWDRNKPTHQRLCRRRSPYMTTIEELTSGLENNRRVHRSGEDCAPCPFFRVTVAVYTLCRHAARTQQNNKISTYTMYVHYIKQKFRHMTGDGLWSNKGTYCENNQSRETLRHLMMSLWTNSGILRLLGLADSICMDYWVFGDKWGLTSTTMWVEIFSPNCRNWST